MHRAPLLEVLLATMRLVANTLRYFPILLLFFLSLSLSLSLLSFEKCAADDRLENANTFSMGKVTASRYFRALFDVYYPNIPLSLSHRLNKLANDFQLIFFLLRTRVAWQPFDAAVFFAFRQWR